MEQLRETLLEAVETADFIKGIRRGLEQVKRGEGRPAEEVIAELRNELGIPADK